MTEPHPPAANPAAEPEDRDINLRGVLSFAGGLFLVAAAVHLLLALYFFEGLHREERDKRSQFPLSAPERAELPQTTFGAPATGQLPGGPRLEGLNLAGRPRGQGAAADKNAKEDAELKDRGTDDAPHVPIDEAMRLVAEGRKPEGHEPAPVRYDAGIPGTGGGSNSGRDISEGNR